MSDRAETPKPPSGTTRYVWFDYDAEVWKWIVRCRAKNVKVVGIEGSWLEAASISVTWEQIYKDILAEEKKPNGTL